MIKNTFSVADLHCDVLSYLVRIPEANWEKAEDIGAALPHLKSGGVKLQVMALFTVSKEGSAHYTKAQVQAWNQLLQRPQVLPVTPSLDWNHFEQNNTIGLLAAIENASGLCEEEEDLSKAWERLDNLEENVGPLLYISFTHHDENRFGGGNYSDNVGLKSDGMALLDRLEGRKIAVDLSHASDKLAEGIFTYSDKQGLNLPIIASHSNFRTIWNHVRNLPDELAQEIINRKGLIGMNFLRAYIDDENPETLFDHFKYGMELGAESQLALGADYFYTKDFHDTSRYPLFHPVYRDASCYPQVLNSLKEKGWSQEEAKKISWNNVKSFLAELWSE